MGLVVARSGSEVTLLKMTRDHRLIEQVFITESTLV